MLFGLQQNIAVAALWVKPSEIGQISDLAEIFFYRLGYVRKEKISSTASCDLWFRSYEVLKFRPRRLFPVFGQPLYIHISVKFGATTEISTVLES